LHYACQVAVYSNVVLHWHCMLTGTWIGRWAYSINESLSSWSAMHSGVPHFKASGGQ